MQTASATTPGRKFNPDQDYADLKRLIKQRGLLEKQPGYYAVKMIITFLMFGVSIAFLVLVDNPWLQLLNAVYLGFMSTQLGFLGHDAGHKQIFHETRKNDIVGLLAGNLCIGLSRIWWVNKHNAHHSNPNQEDMDPDVDIPILAFTEEQALSRTGIFRELVKHQAFYLIPITSLQAVGMHNVAFETLLKQRPKGYILELFLLILHFVLYFWLVFSSLSVPFAIAFMVIHKAVFGIYNSSVFAPNHKGMPVLPKDTPLDFFRRQVITARNIKAHPFTDFWYGGLNYQIEHHLFPSMPRNLLRLAQPIVIEYCQSKGIIYYETGILQSYREILEHLHEVSAPLRRKELATPAK